MSDVPSQERRGPGRPSNAEIAAREAAATHGEEPSALARAATQSAAGEDIAALIRPDNDDHSDEGLARRKATRKPFGAFVQKLSYPVRPNYHRHVFNDEDGRLELAQEAGYTFVKKDGNPIKRVVGTAKAGGPLFGYLMEIPQEWYDEDMRNAQKRVDETDTAIRRGEMISGKAAEDSQQRFYASSQGRQIKIQNERR